MSRISEKYFSYGPRLKEERVRLGKTQEEFASAGGVSVQTVRNYESGRRTPDAPFLDSLVSSGLDVDVQYIVTGVRWGALGPRDTDLAALSPQERAMKTMSMVLRAQAKLGFQFDEEFIKGLGEYVFRECPTQESLEAFIRALYVVQGAPLRESATQQVTGHGNITAGGSVSGVNVGGVSVDTPAKKGTKKKK
ncbi:MAG: helix-turn-helix transcriptional regulator [FCB group bacterium]|jgi:transcriptional regulator with XRE-family HTH domain|nr:helix-turn-helix transcriptional regulator [FCB group bacterium]